MKNSLHINKYLHICKVSLINKLAYIGDTISFAGFFVVILFVFTQLWETVYAQTGETSVAGFTKNQMIWYLMLTETILLSFPKIEGQINEDIKSGTIAYILNKPYSYIGYQFSIYTGELLSKLLINFTVGLITVSIFTRSFEINIMYMPFILIAMFMAFVLNFFIIMSIALSAFIIEDTIPFFWIYQKILFTIGGLFVPIAVFPEFFKNIALNLPFNYILYSPAQLALHFDWNYFIKVIANQSIWIIITGIITYLIYRAGVRNLDVNGG